MDSYRDYAAEFETADTAAEDHGPDASIGTDERRMHVRAYNYWVSLLDGRDYPSIEDLEPGDLKDFAPHSVLLDFTAGRDNPATPYIGDAIRVECDLPEQVTTIDEVPSRSLLSRLTDHYMQIIANRAPVGFEAEFDNQRNETISYRGILMPFSSDGETIDFIYGVINWKKGDGVAPVLRAALPPIAADEEPLELTDAVAFDDQPLDLTEPLAEPAAAYQVPHIDEPAEDLGTELGDDAGLADRLWAARESAEAVKDAEGRSREALYRALSRAYDFALAAMAEPDDYAELLEDSGMKAQARAPMTPVVKLVFGIDYDKARLTEYSAALSFAHRQGVETGAFFEFITRQAGGLKALVVAERAARRPQPKTDTRTEQAREKLRTAPTLSAVESDEEFALVLTRRTRDGVHEAVAIVDDDAMVERAIRKVGA
ncbi:hypothetical protein H8M03_10460 [Sphingomonas sabuli]|uniref:PAS domain-containing protein n=1 Tax=Sphingomonas sabuli TaxID=2764186 RepID=A0A7G9L1C7_9SPHN|nr:hypothetical protein [Sphingomonas sabuli]QNM82426.1 hypothetical protein H8M03_10460 [Sphingomonas sabuli]